MGGLAASLWPALVMARAVVTRKSRSLCAHSLGLQACAAAVATRVTSARMKMQDLAIVVKRRSVGGGSGWWLAKITAQRQNMRSFVAVKVSGCILVRCARDLAHPVATWLPRVKRRQVTGTFQKGGPAAACTSIPRKNNLRINHSHKINFKCVFSLPTACHPNAWCPAP